MPVMVHREEEEEVDGLIQESMSKRKMTPVAIWKRNLSAAQRHVACRIALHVDRTAIICREDKRRVFPHVCPLERIYNLDRSIAIHDM